MIKSAPKSKYADWGIRHRKGKANIGTYVEPEIKKALKQAAMRQQISVAEALRDAINDYLNAEPK